MGLDLKTCTPALREKILAQLAKEGKLVKAKWYVLEICAGANCPVFHTIPTRNGQEVAIRGQKYINKHPRSIVNFYTFTTMESE